MKNITKILPIIFMFIASCGSGGAGNGAKNVIEGSGSIKAVVLNSKSFDPNISHGKIMRYRVTVTSADMAEPITKDFDGGAESGVIDNIPSGMDRTVKVEAINPNEKVIRAGESAGLEISGGAITETIVSMGSVPVFMNLNDGNVVPNTRLVAKIFADPSDAVTVEDDAGAGSVPLFDLNTMDDKIFPDASTGAATFAPSILTPGEHRLVVKNIKTGRSSEVNVRVIDGAKLRPAPIYNGGSAGISRLGGVLTQGVTYEK